LPASATARQTPGVIKSAIIHLANELPIMVDLLEPPSPTAQSVRCTNVRTVDGKRPGFVQDAKSTLLRPGRQVDLRLSMAPDPADRGSGITHGRPGSRHAGSRRASAGATTAACPAARRGARRRPLGPHPIGL